MTAIGSLPHRRPGRHPARRGARCARSPACSCATDARPGAPRRPRRPLERALDRPRSSWAAGGAEYPLALAQMRDAVEHLRRVDLLEAFPLRIPQRRAAGDVLRAASSPAWSAFSPNPWLLRARASNPAITIAREQAQRVERLADSIQPQDSAELEPCSELLRKGARTIDARSADPGEALNALEDLEEQVHQMSAGDDQLAAALAAIAGALAADPTTQQLASAINTGDLREISQAAKDLAQQTDSLSGQDSSASPRSCATRPTAPGRASPSVAGDLADAAAAMEAGRRRMARWPGQTAPTSRAARPARARGQQRAAHRTAARRATRSNQLSSDAAAAAGNGSGRRASSKAAATRWSEHSAAPRAGPASSGRSSSSQRGQSAAGAQAGDQSQGAGPGSAPATRANGRRWGRRRHARHGPGRGWRTRARAAATRAAGRARTAPALARARCDHAPRAGPERRRVRARRESAEPVPRRGG